MAGTDDTQDALDTLPTGWSVIAWGWDEDGRVWAVFDEDGLMQGSGTDLVQAIQGAMGS